MQRGGYGNPGPAQSPPLHHPIPQHVSSVPQLRSPPPPSQPMPQNGYGGYGQAQGQGQGSQFMTPAFGNFMNDPTTQMGFQMGATAVTAGQQYVEQNFNRYVNVSAIKHYFNVTNSYVVQKLFLVLFPFRHKPWTRKQAQGGGQETYFLPPREDINSPDMYIPAMAFVTYTLLSTMLAGLRGHFHPELLGTTATAATLCVIVEIMGLKLACYLLAISNDSQIYDLIAYSGYKFVGIIVTTLVGEIANRGAGTGGWVGWTVFIYTWFALAFFLLRSMKYVLLPDSTNPSGASRSQRSRRTQFLFVYSFVVQFVFMWLLSTQESGLRSGIKGGLLKRT